MKPQQQELQAPGSIQGYTRALLGLPFFHHSHSSFLLKEITLTVISLPVPISFSSSQTQSLSFSGLSASGKCNPLHQETSNRKNILQHRCTQWRLCS
ncbi:hypothetical protein AVEN_19493-1 [Araneus ventricosus]|uniref:Uncharacterized protein n=1 Tax=Araneus ventricosus TaxID=182803 RepID=A0A4Y2VFK3_ARAVE|nr:hypothetical protein AVEN_19493-1 [Araneus ventricosus]